MQVVIDIPDGYVGVIMKNQRMEGSIMDKMIRQAIIDGVQLPKGHGTLKDVDNIKTAFPSGEYVRTESVRATIDYEDTIVKADKGE